MPNISHVEVVQSAYFEDGKIVDSLNKPVEVLLLTKEELLQVVNNGNNLPILTISRNDVLNKYYSILELEDLGFKIVCDSSSRYILATRDCDNLFNVYWYVIDKRTSKGEWVVFSGYTLVINYIVEDTYATVPSVIQLPTDIYTGIIGSIQQFFLKEDY